MNPFICMDHYVYMYDIRQEVLDVGRAWKRGYKTGCQSVITIHRLSIVRNTQSHFRFSCSEIATKP